MEVKVRVGEIIRLLNIEYSETRIELNHRNPLELLIATILSAQCTDERVNQVTQPLFKKYKSVTDFAEADLGELEDDVRPTGFYRSKARYIKESSRMLISDFNSQVPNNMEALFTLPGVARKTANIVLSNAFGIVVGIAVDTHVRRLSQRLGLTNNKQLDKIEKDLMQIVPEEKWLHFTHLLIQHGRNICKARKPRCLKCLLGRRLCPSFSKFS